METPGPVPQAASSLDRVLSPVIAELGGWVRQTPGTLSLAQGMVGWSPPDGVLSALAVALQDPGSGLHRYGAVQGEPPLLEAIQRHLGTHHHLDLEGSELWVTAGSNMAFSAMAQVICGAGAADAAEVILPLPYYFNHVMAIQLAGGLPVPVDAGLIPDLERLEAAITPRTRAIVTVSPNNPSGVVIPQRVLAGINALCARRGCFTSAMRPMALLCMAMSPIGARDRLPAAVPTPSRSIPYPRRTAWPAGGLVTWPPPSSSRRPWPRFRTRC